MEWKLMSHNLPPNSLLIYSPGEATGPTKSMNFEKIMQAVCPHMAFLGYFNRLPTVAGANRRRRLPFRYRGSRHESAVAQLSTSES
jgi:hypothetical protein